MASPPDSGLHVLVTKPGPGFDPTATESAVRAALTTAGARVATVQASVVESIPAGAAGKRPLIVANANPPAKP